MRTIPPRVVIIPPSSSSTISSASSGFSTSSETRPLIQRNAQLRARFFDQQQNDGRERKSQSLERAVNANAPEIRSRVRSCRIPPPPIPPHYALISVSGQNENEGNEGRPWWRPPMESPRGKLAAKSGSWWTRLKAHFQDKEREYERSIGQPQKVVGPEEEEEEKPRKWQSSSERGGSRKKAVPACFLYTANRKKNKENRMEQGPREYVSCKDILVDFCARTSSHGIPFVGTHSFFGRPFWATVTAIAFCSFIIQTYFTLSDYVEYRTIIEMQLKFEPAPFPAATICNLNAFKLSEVRKFEEIEQGIQLWERAISTLDRFKESPTRRRRQAVYRPVLARCVCTNADDQCVPQQNKLDRNPSVCLCYEDQDTGDIWPCYLHAVWKQKKCPHCSNSNTCDDPDKPPNITATTPSSIRNRIIIDDESSKKAEGPVACLCQPISHYCLRDTRQPGQDFDWWNPHNYSIYPSTTRPPPSDVEEAFGLEDLKDRGAITTKTKENLIFLVAGMSREIRQSLSYKLHEFVLRCSFNSKDCDLNRDFQIQIDPEYGNCWTFNFNDSVELKNSRAGPMYGLRLLLNVNQSDYMPTTEAAGVRIVVHEQDQEPFPDTFGYSAPTGFVSSFGLKTKILHRLDSPYGKCSDTFRPAGYIYAEHYSPEGCYRNCFQHIILERCACGDPRFPLPNESEDRPCDARNPKERACLANQTAVLGGFHHLTHDCHCVQPCTGFSDILIHFYVPIAEHTFETAYSASAWPAQNFNIGKDDCALVLGKNFTMEECTEYYRKNTALIEIYYEQLNYEKLKETPGYTLVNLFSDLGGNIGLWIGFSLITVLEIVELIFECLTFGCKLCVYRPLQRKAQLRNQRRHDDDREEENLDGRTEFRHGGSGHSQISRRSFHGSQKSQPGSDGPALDGHKYQYQRRWARAGSAGPTRSWTTRLPIRHTVNMPPSIDERQTEETNGIASAGPILDQYTYTYTFANPFDSPKNGIGTHQNSQIPNTVQFASSMSIKK